MIRPLSPFLVRPLLLGLLASAGCASPDEPASLDSAPTSIAVPDAAPEGSTQTADATPVNRTGEHLAQAVLDDPDAVYASFVAAQVAPAALRYVLLDEESPVRLRRREFLASLYHERAFAPVFFTDATTHARIGVLVDELGRVHEHALDPDRYLTPELLQTTRDAQEWRAAAAHRPLLDLSQNDRSRLAERARGLGTLSREEATTALFAWALDDSTDGFETLRAHHAEAIELEQIAAGAAALAEALWMDTLLNYAFDQRHFNVAMLTDASDEEQHAVIAERMRGTFTAFAQATSEQTLRELLHALPPSHPQYPLLVRERARYAQIVEAGGWEEVRPTSLRRGSRGARVAELKRRLQIEGYYDGPIDESFGAALEQAVRDYQETHQMAVTGESSRDFWSSLNIPADQRLAQIEVTMQRWRESRIGDDPYYIFVNIPDFHTEVWRDGERQTRFRIVVGNTQRVCDTRTGQWRMPNATPVQSAMMSYVVLNPYWNIPSRILEEELLPSLVNREDYFERQGIEVVEVNGSRRVRQRPGPQNPLGRVKFMFPNPHDTYLHDTSRPQYFQYPIRAFSHGCMRVQEPLNFLELLLRNDDQWDPARVEQIFASEQETSIRFRTPVPVHVEYYVVRVDDEGRANFAADIYRYDRERISPSSPDQLRCTPAARPEHRLVLGADGRPMLRDSEGNLIDPASLQGGSGDPTTGDFGP